MCYLVVTVLFALFKDYYNYTSNILSLYGSIALLKNILIHLLNYLSKSTCITLVFIVICPSGYGAASADSCSLCEVGTYRSKDIDAVDNTCTVCPEYFTTAQAGATVVADCTVCE